MFYVNVPNMERWYRELILALDYGGEIALNYISEIRDDIDEKKLFAPLRRRVVGS